MAKKNPAHYRAEFEFHATRVFVTCTCGWFKGDGSLDGAVNLLKQHHKDAAFPSAIYKED